MDISNKLVHSITITPISGQNAWGGLTTATAINSVLCFIYGDRRRVIDNKGSEIQINYSIIFGKTTLNSFSNMLDFTVSNGKDSFGNTILSSGRIVAFRDSHHPVQGPISREVSVILN